MKPMSAVVCGAALAAAVLAPGCSYRTPEPSPPDPQRGPVVPVAEYQLSKPYTHRSLTVFFVRGRETLTSPLTTLPDALGQGTMVVHEVLSGGQVFAENRSAGEEVFVQAGDLLRGGVRDRAVHFSAVVGPNTGRVPVMTWDVDGPNRAAEHIPTFPTSPFTLGTSDLRRVAYSPKQSGRDMVRTLVEREVVKTEDLLGVRGVGDKPPAAPHDKCGGTMPQPSSLPLAYGASPVRSAVAPYVAALGRAADRHRDAIGYVAVVNGRVVSADVYASRALFRSLWPRLLDGSAVEAAIAERAGVRLVPPSGVDVWAFLAPAEYGGLYNRVNVRDGSVYSEERRTDAVMMFDYGDPSRGNLIVHRCFLAR